MHARLAEVQSQRERRMAAARAEAEALCEVRSSRFRPAVT